MCSIFTSARGLLLTILTGFISFFKFFRYANVEAILNLLV